MSAAKHGHVATELEVADETLTLLTWAYMDVYILSTPVLYPAA